MRLFIAVDPGEPAAARIAEMISTLRTSYPDAKWAGSEKPHLTMAFLGEVTEERVPAVREAMAEAAAGCAAFRLAPGGAGAFPSWPRARVVWLGVREGAPELSRLAGRLHAALKARGFSLEEREFHPHLTLARAGQGGRGLARARADAERLADAPGWAGCAGEVSSLELLKSTLSPGGARHESVHRQEFARA